MPLWNLFEKLGAETREQERNSTLTNKHILFLAHQRWLQWLSRSAFYQYSKKNTYSLPLRKQSQTWNCGAVLLSENKDHHFQMHVSYNNCKTKKKKHWKTNKKAYTRQVHRDSFTAMYFDLKFLCLQKQKKKIMEKAAYAQERKRKKEKKRTSLQLSDEKWMSCYYLFVISLIVLISLHEITHPDKLQKHPTKQNNTKSAYKNNPHRYFYITKHR